MDKLEELYRIALRLQSDDPNGLWIEGYEDVIDGEFTISEMAKDFIDAIKNKEELIRLDIECIEDLKRLL